MGYTHYWSFGKGSDKDEEGFNKALPIIRDICNRHKDIIVRESDEDLPPDINEEYHFIRFNGIEDDGHETFLFELTSGDFNFCKTARKPYDLPVCECLIVLAAHIPSVTISSDGFGRGNGYDGKWETAIRNVKELYGIEFSRTD